jgi:hypothetical protein
VAWAEADPGVTLVGIDAPTGGRVLAAGRAAPTGDGAWRYTYAVENLNMGASIGGVVVPVPPGADVSAFGFRDVDYHSGEPWDGTDWPGERCAGVVRWRTTPYEQNPAANALRWSTLYAFSFTSSAAPAEALVRLEPFAAGAAPLEALLPAPGGCAADVDGDGALTFADLLAVLAAWGPCPCCAADLDGDGVAGFADVLIVLAAWGGCG